LITIFGLAAIALKLASVKIADVTHYVKEGDMIDVKLLEIDQKTGKFKLSRKALLPRPPREDKPKAE
jgi:predicted RNA-binding protein with RPS1 domain